LSHIFRLPWDFLFKLCVKLIPILNSRLEYCVSWRTQVEEYLNDEQNENTDIYSVDNLVPLIDSSLEIISVLKLSVKKVKQDASKKRKRVSEIEPICFI
jgi:protein-arginine kinase